MRWTFAKTIGYPVIVRPAYTLGRFGRRHLRKTKRNWRKSPRTACVCPRSRRFWSRSAFPAGRKSNSRSCATSNGNVIAVCSMENIDPVGVHTGDSHRHCARADIWRTRNTRCSARAALDIITALEVEGGCNCPVRAQSGYALNMRSSRSTPARQPFLRPGVQGDRLPDCQGAPTQDRHRLHAGRNEERRDRHDLRLRLSPRIDYVVVEDARSGRLTSSCTPSETSARR